MNQFDYGKVKNPEFFRENRLEAHSDHVSYRSHEEQREGKTSLRMSLNGLWKFSYAPNYESVIKDFEKPECDCRGWADIRVPAHIQMEGYDAPQYANVQYPWDGREEALPGQIPQRFNPVASYVKYFEVPEEWRVCSRRLIVYGICFGKVTVAGSGLVYHITYIGSVGNEMLHKSLHIGKIAAAVVAHVDDQPQAGAQI